MDWVHSDRVQVINTNRRERSVARNTGAAIARGKYLNFLDDDDLLLPGALEAFWNLARARKAIWLSGGWQTIDNDGKLVNEFCPSLKGNIFALLVAGEGLPCGASLYDHEEFFASGGFDPQIVGVEDRDLGRRMALRGDINSTDKIVARIRIGEQGSTTVWSTLPEKDRWGREKALMQKGASSRLRKSANSNYLRGRACRALVASMVWNVKAQEWIRCSEPCGNHSCIGWLSSPGPRVLGWLFYEDKIVASVYFSSEQFGADYPQNTNCH